MTETEARRLAWEIQVALARISIYDDRVQSLEMDLRQAREHRHEEARKVRAIITDAEGRKAAVSPELWAVINSGDHAAIARACSLGA